MNMKRMSTLLLLGISMGSAALAKQVDEQTAKTAATNFIASKMGNKAIHVSLKAKYSLQETGHEKYNTYYIFNVNEDNGFVVVAADDIIKPILAYSTNSPFEVGNNESPETDYWMNIYSNEIYYALTHGHTATEEVTAQWQLLSEGGNVANKPTSFVDPLLTTRWNQGQYYDIYTPGSGPLKTPVGCVATAMAQIMKYWDAPTTGTGSYSYTHPSYGTLSADFGATTYQWGIMPNALTSASSQAAKEAVSLLGYHCAVSVKMDFGPDGSGSFVLAWNSGTRCAENSFKNHFGYKPTIQGVERADYTEANWIALLKSELDAERPILYAGYGQVGGHAFVFDGYDESDLFHINWGWGGMSNGYFTVNNLAPSALGIGGGGGNFNSGQQALIKIEPSQPGDTLNMVLNSNITVSAPQINKGDPFTVTAAIRNLGTFDFGGILSAGVYNSTDSSLVSYVQYLSNQTILGGNDTTLTFSTNGINAMVAGEYFIKAIYRQEGATSWTAVPEDNGFINRVNIVVVDAPNPTGIHNSSLENSISVYPNPSNETLTIDTKGFNGKVNAVNILNIQGQKVTGTNNIISGKIEISTQQLANGFYFIRLETDQGTIARKFVVKH
jgi:hypothetical protein